jgi:hypothetical protein
MSFYADVDGEQILHGRVVVPYYGTWTVDAMLEHGVELGKSVTVTIGSLVLKGTTFAAFPFAGKTSCRIVGGANGWPKVLPPRAYFNPNGVKLSLVLGAAAKECGETLGALSDTSIGTAYVRLQGPAVRVLSILAGESWYVDYSGVTQIAARGSGTIVSDFEAINASSGERRVTVASEALADWVPGRTFSSPRLAQKTIGSVVHQIEPRAIRTEVYVQ